MDFNLTDLRLFVLVTDEGSITRAAEKQHLSLAAASTRIKALEEQVGQQLFYRQARGVTVTPPGEAFLHHALGVLRQVHQLQTEMQEYAGGLRGHVRLYANTTAVTDFLPEILAPFLTANPRVNVELQERPNSEVAKGVLDGRADLGIVSGPMDIQGLQAIHFSTDHLVLVVQAQHRFASYAEISFADTLEDNHVGMHATSTLHEFLDQVTEKLGKVLKLRIQVNSFDGMCRMIAAGVGIGVVPESAALRCAKDLDVCLVPLIEPWSIRKRHILFRDQSKLPNYAHALVQAICDHYTSPGDVSAPV